MLDVDRSRRSQCRLSGTKHALDRLLTVTHEVGLSLTKCLELQLSLHQVVRCRGVGRAVACPCPAAVLSDHLFATVLVGIFHPTVTVLQLN